MVVSEHHDELIESPETGMNRRTLLTAVGIGAVGTASFVSSPAVAQEKGSTPGAGTGSSGGASDVVSPGTTQSLGNRQTYSVTTEQLGFESAGNRIYGEIKRPNVQGKAPVVIMSHGFGGNHAQEPHMQDLLAQHGVVVYSYDFAGGSGFEPGQSEGNMTDMSVMTEVQNLRDALTLVRGLDYVNTNCIYLIGASQGGVVTTLVADENPEGVKGVALLYPALSLFDDAHERFPRREDITDTTNLMGLTVGRRYFEDVYDINIYEHMSFKGQVLIFHGTADDIVPISYSQRASATFGNANLTTLDGEGHGFTDAAQETVADGILGMISG